MIHTRYFESDGIPLVACEETHLQPAAGKKCILFFHGFKGSKESNLRELNSLASHGYLAVGVDALGHGARRYADFDQRFTAGSSTGDREFIKIVRETAAEVPRILDHLSGEYDMDGFGVAGISMGGFITYAAIMLEPRLRTAVSILGSPHWSVDLPHSPDHHIEAFSSVHLLSMNAGKDELVPAHFARDFHIALGEYYADYERRFDYVEYPNSGHFMDDADWRLCWARALSWFAAHNLTSTT
ncbi:MAG: hypothetical protein GYA52_03870 [Chloroflexi bacterium]|nr:hypothetical protein [Chloroflexota bacterium]